MDANQIRSIITGALLLAFIVVFVQEALVIWSRRKPDESEARTYVWTAISVPINGKSRLMKDV